MQCTSSLRQPCKYEVVDVGEKYPGQNVGGQKFLGTVATELIRRGDLIAADTPFIIRHRYYYDKPRNNGTSASQENDDIRKALTAMSKERQREFLSLYNPRGEAKVAFVDTFGANSLSLSTAYGAHSYLVAIFLKLARMNHNCSPNAEYSFNDRTKEGRVFAVRNINVGEEITINYCQSRWHWSVRREMMVKNFNFKCACPYVCRDGNETSLANTRSRFTAIDKLTRDLVNPDKIILFPEYAMLKIYRLEYLRNRMDTRDSRHAEVYYLAWQVCVAQGDIERSRIFGIRAYAGFRDCLGFENEYTMGLLEKIESPITQPFWAKGPNFHHFELTPVELRHHNKDISRLTGLDLEKWLFCPGKVYWRDRDTSKMYIELNRIAMMHAGGDYGQTAPPVPVNSTGDEGSTPRVVEVEDDNYEPPEAMEHGMEGTLAGGTETQEMAEADTRGIREEDESDDDIAVIRIMPASEFFR